MAKGLNEIKARVYAHEVRRRLAAAGLKIGMGHVYEALAAGHCCLSYTEWRGRGWPAFDTGNNPVALIMVRMTGLGYPIEHGELVAKVVHDVLNGKESSYDLNEIDQSGRPDPGGEPG